MTGRGRPGDGWEEEDRRDGRRDPWQDSGDDTRGSRGDRDRGEGADRPVPPAAGGYAGPSFQPKNGAGQGYGASAPQADSYPAGQHGSRYGDGHGSPDGNGYGWSGYGGAGSDSGYGAGRGADSAATTARPAAGYPADGYQGAGYGRGGYDGNGPAANGYENNGRGANGYDSAGYAAGGGGPSGHAQGGYGGAYAPEFSPADDEDAADDGPTGIPRPIGRLSIYTLLDHMTAEFDRFAERAAEGVRANEPDTLVYVIHVVPKAPMQRIVYEIYRDRAAFENHERQPHIQRFVADRAACLLATNIIDLRLKYAKVTALGTAQSDAFGARASGTPRAIGAGAAAADYAADATSQYSAAKYPGSSQYAGGQYSGGQYSRDQYADGQYGGGQYGGGQYSNEHYQPTQAQYAAPVASFTPVADRNAPGQYAAGGAAPGTGTAGAATGQYGYPGNGSYGAGGGQYPAANGYDASSGYANGNGNAYANGGGNANGGANGNGAGYGQGGYSAANGSGSGYSSGTGYPDSAGGTYAAQYPDYRPHPQANGVGRYRELGSGQADDGENGAGYAGNQDDRYADGRDSSRPQSPERGRR